MIWAFLVTCFEGVNDRSHFLESPSTTVGAEYRPLQRGVARHPQPERSNIQPCHASGNEELGDRATSGHGTLHACSRRGVGQTKGFLRARRPRPSYASWSSVLVASWSWRGVMQRRAHVRWRTWHTVPFPFWTCGCTPIKTTEGYLCTAEGAARRMTVQAWCFAMGARRDTTCCAWKFPSLRYPRDHGLAISTKLRTTQFITVIGGILNHEPHEHNKSEENLFRSATLWWVLVGWCDDWTTPKCIFGERVAIHRPNLLHFEVYGLFGKFERNIDDAFTLVSGPS